MRRRVMTQEKRNDNLFIAENVTADSYLKNSGDIGKSTGGCVSDFIEFKEGETYYIESKIKWRNCVYKADKTILADYTKDGIWKENLIAPAGAAYIRLCIYNEYIATTIFKKVS